MPKEKLIKKKATVGGYNVSKIVDKIDMRQTEHKQVKANVMKTLFIETYG